MKLRFVYHELVSKLDARSVANEMVDQLTKSKHDTIIGRNRTNEEAAKTLVDILLKSSVAVYESFVAALQQANQEHIIRLIECAGTHDDDDDDDDDDEGDCDCHLHGLITYITMHICRHCWLVKDGQELALSDQFCHQVFLKRIVTRSFSGSAIGRFQTCAAAAVTGNDRSPIVLC